MRTIRRSTFCRPLLTILFGLALGCPGIPSNAQYKSTNSSEDFRMQHAVPAGPYSVVNTATGTLITTIPLVRLTGPGGTVLDFTLYHTLTGPTSSYKGQVARNWRHSFDEGITDNTAGALPTAATQAQRNSPGGGVSEWYRNPASNPWSRNPGVRDDLAADGTGYTVTHKDRTSASYHNQKPGSPNTYMLTSLTDTHNNTISVTYDVNGRVSTITDAAGRMLTLNYSGDFTLQSVVLNAGSILREWDFSTDANQNLTAIKFPSLSGNFKQITITPDANFAASGRFTDLYDLNNNHWKYSYVPFGTHQVVSQVFPPDPNADPNLNSALFSFSYSTPPNQTQTIITDRANHATTHLYNTYTNSNGLGGAPFYAISTVTDPPVTGDTQTYSATYTWRTSDMTLTSMVDRNGKT